MTVGVERKLSEVFGVARGIPLNYVRRAYVDDLFINSLSRDKHIVVFGGSKQGKTSLRKQTLNEDDYVVVQCGNTTTRAQIYEMLLKCAGAHVTATDKRTTTGTAKFDVTVSAKGKVPLVAEASGSGGGGYQKTTTTEVSGSRFEIDPSDPNDVIRVLKAAEFSKYVILEDFHYLSEEVQREIAFDLKAFHEKSNLVFVVVGVWLESNKLVLYNGDLAGRLVPVDADRWDPSDLSQVIEEGEKLLNVEFPESVKKEVLDRCQNNVGVLQETCYRLCERANVWRTQPQLLSVGSVSEVDVIIHDIGTEQAGRYQKFLEDFSEGLNKTELEMYKWIAYVAITSDPADLKRGLKMSYIFRTLNEVHPTRKGQLQQNNVTQALAKIGKLQHKNHVKPTILDFDTSENRLRVTDSGFILYLITQERKALLETIGVEMPP
ncbi:hypothetical protein [Archangium primigenium]|uniref:hypothetical protein n=1 Tax=[Archangium] primigenium TaxID=2792470 RepID=UPI00195E3F9C|nr:hypothetical protein [Archangium primigenium]MBM7116064.1 hypothetical protein [Archangium primigenium]